MILVIARPSHKTSSTTATTMEADTSLSSDQVVPHLGVLVNHRHVKALIDSGAQVSVLSQSFAEQNNLKLHKRDDIEIAFADDQAISDCQWTTTTISNSDVVHEHLFLVLPKLRDAECLVGTDLFKQLGVQISVPNPFTVLGHNDMFNDAMEPIDVEGLPDNERSVIADAVQSALQSNATTISDFCVLKSAMDIRLHDMTKDQAKALRQYPIPFVYHDRVSEELKAMQQNGWIEVCQQSSPQNNPITVATKKGSDKIRICLDARHPNKFLMTDSYQLPMIKDILGLMKGKKVFSVLDLKNAYWKMSIHPDDRWMTAFMWNGKQYQYVSAPMGMKPMASKFQRVICQALDGLNCAAPYQDDVIVYSDSVEDHVKDLLSVINALTKAHLTINVDKLQLACKSVHLLGHTVGERGIAIDKRKLINVQDWHRPATGEQVMQLLGLLNFFRDHLPVYAKVAAPLERLRMCKAITATEWTEECERAWQTMKDLLLQAPILSLPDFTKPFTVGTDACGTGIGAVLYQQYPDVDGIDRVHYISFLARALKPAERNYGAPKLELLGLIYAITKFRPYLFGHEFTVYTDHDSLTDLFTTSRPKAVSGQWVEVLSEMPFKVVHLPGIENHLPDMLSRLVSSETVHLSLRAVHIAVQDAHHLAVAGEGERLALMQKAHVEGHYGSLEMVNKIAEAGFTWTGIHGDCRRLVQLCDTCNRYNVGKKGYHPLTPVHAELPMDHIAFDLAGPLPSTKHGNNYMLVVVDIATRMVWLEALQSHDQYEVAQVLLKLFSRQGFPKIVQRDNAKEFVSATVKTLLSLMGTAGRRTTEYNPQANGAAERHVQSAVRTLKKMIDNDDHTDRWDEYLPMTEYFLNKRIASLTQSSPFALYYGRRHNALEDYSSVRSMMMSNMELTDRWSRMLDIVYPDTSQAVKKKQQHMKEMYDKKKSMTSFSLGDIVMFQLPDRHLKKLSPAYDGPCRVTVVRTPSRSSRSYEIAFLDGSNDRRVHRGFAPHQLKVVSRPQAVLAYNDKTVTLQYDSGIILDVPRGEAPNDFLSLVEEPDEELQIVLEDEGGDM